MSIMNQPTIYKSSTIYKTGAGGGVDDDLGVEIANKWYRVIKANNLYWLAEDLRAKIDGITFEGPDNGPSYRIYEGSTINFLAFGCLYTWHCIQIIQNYLDNNNTGWRIPTIEDYTQLFDCVGGQNNCGLALQKKKEDSFSWWGGNAQTDEIGFSKGGSGFFENGSYYSIRAVGYAWTSNEVNTTSSKMAAFRDLSLSVPFENEYKKRFISIRLCKNV